MIFASPLLAREFGEGKGGHTWKRNGPVSRSIKGWEEGFVVFISTPILTVS